MQMMCFLLIGCCEFSGRKLEISKTDLNSWFKGSNEEIEHMMKDDEIRENGKIKPGKALGKLF